jgi:hypothetical protein
MDFTLPPHLSKSNLKLVCNVNIVYGNLKSENFQVFAQKAQRNCTFMNSASVYNGHHSDKPSSALFEQLPIKEGKAEKQENSEIQ